jgi:hypothetical protein
MTRIDVFIDHWAGGMTRPYSLAGSASRASGPALPYKVSPAGCQGPGRTGTPVSFFELKDKAAAEGRKDSARTRQRLSRSDRRAAVTKALPPNVSLAADLIRLRRREPRGAAFSPTLSVWSHSTQREHAQMAKHPSAEHHHNAASHHHAAAHHHHQAEHHHAMGEDEEAQDHAKAAKEHSELAHKHSETAHEHSHE